MQYYHPTSFIPNVHQNQDSSSIANAHREAALYHLSQMNQHRPRNEGANQRDTYNPYDVANPSANPAETSRKRQFEDTFFARDIRPMLQPRDAHPPNAPRRVSRPAFMYDGN